MFNKKDVKIMDKTNTVLVIVCAVLLIIFIGGILVAKSGLLIGSQYKEKSCENTEELQKEFKNKLDIPEIVINDKISDIKYYNSDYAYIQCSDMAYKVNKSNEMFINPFGDNIEYNYKVTYKTDSSKTDTEFVTFMIGKIDDVNYTLINWYKEDYSYAILKNGTYTLNDVLQWINVDANDIVVE